MKHTNLEATIRDISIRFINSVRGLGVLDEFLCSYWRGHEAK